MFEMTRSLGNAPSKANGERKVPAGPGAACQAPGTLLVSAAPPRLGSGSARGQRGTEGDRGRRALRGSDTKNSRSRAGHRKYPKPPNALERFHTRTQLPAAKCHRYLLRVKLSSAQRNQHRSEPRPWQISCPSQTHPSGSACAWVNQIFMPSKKRRSEGLGSRTSGSHIPLHQSTCN